MTSFKQVSSNQGSCMLSWYHDNALSLVLKGNQGFLSAVAKWFRKLWLRVGGGLSLKLRAAHLRGVMFCVVGSEVGGFL